MREIYCVFLKGEHSEQNVCLLATVGYTAILLVFCVLYTSSVSYSRKHFFVTAPEFITATGILPQCRRGVLILHPTNDKDESVTT